MPAPPYFSGKMTPRKPISASLGIISEGNWEASSHCITCGAISASANSRTVRRRCCCSSVRENSTIRLYHGALGAAGAKARGGPVNKAKAKRFTAETQRKAEERTDSNGEALFGFAQDEATLQSQGGDAGAAAYRAQGEISKGADQEGRIVERGHHVKIAHTERLGLFPGFDVDLVE